MSEKTNEIEAVPQVEPDKHVKETVRYDFSDSELTEVAREQAQKLRDRATLEAEKKRVAKQYGGRIETLDGEIEAMTDNITSGYEMRQVECAVFYDQPKQGYKSIIRTDNGKLVREERMTEMERQINLDLKEGEEADSEKTEPKTEEPEEAKLEAVSEKGKKALGEESKPEEPNSFVSVEEEAFPTQKKLLFKTKDGDEFAGCAVFNDDWGDEKTDIIRSSDNTSIPLSVVIAWRELTDEEKEEANNV